MAHYKADVWLGSNSGFQTIEINSSSFSGVSEQICNLYNVRPENIRNIRESRSESIGSFDDDGSGTLLMIGAIGLFLLFAFFTPYVLMGIFGTGSAWLATKISGKTIKELNTPENSRLYSLILIASLSSGCFGFILGDKIQKDYINEDKQVQVK